MRVNLLQGLSSGWQISVASEWLNLFFRKSQAVIWAGFSSKSAFCGQVLCVLPRGEPKFLNYMWQLPTDYHCSLKI